MFVSIRFLAYEAWTRQNHACAECDSAIHAADIDQRHLRGTELLLPASYMSVDPWLLTLSCFRGSACA